MPRLSICVLSVTLALSACATGLPTAAPTPALEGTSWRLASFQSGDDGVGALQPRAADQFTLSFGKDGRLAAKLDCNRGTGPWQAVAGDATSGTLSLGPVATTRMMCPPDPIGTRLSADLQSLRSYRLQDNRLHTGLPADAGVYIWERVTP
jgi:heat shock protein HslJ